MLIGSSLTPEGVMGLLPATSLEAEARAEWLAALARSRLASIQVHPDHACGNGSLVYVRWNQSHDAITALGVLAPKMIELVPVAGLRRVMRLHGYRLAGDRMFGDDDPTAVAEFATLLADALQSKRAECILVEDLESPSPLWNELVQVAGKRQLRISQPGELQTHRWIVFPEDPQEYWTKFSTKSRNTLRRRMTHFEHSFTRIDRAEQVAEFLSKAKAISLKSWQGRRLGVRVQDDEKDRGEFMLLAREGALRCYLLEHDKSPVAFIFGAQFDHNFVYEETGFDSDYADSSPGEILFCRMLEDFVAHNCPRVFDFGRGDAEYKRRFANQQTTSGPLLLTGNSLKPRIGLAVNRARMWADQNGRALLRKIGLYERIRRLYRRK
jgi:CelD/BcsL family acetyltransferase involved in cellulose biosynthesis